VPFDSFPIRHPSIYIPRLIYHDFIEQNVITEDLGNLTTLDKLLETKGELSPSIICSAAKKLGSFLADFHLSTNSRNRNVLVQDFTSRRLAEIVYGATVEPTLGILREYNIPNAQKVHEIVEAEFHRVRQDDNHRVINHGSLRIESILATEDGTNFGIINWEFATYAAPSQDIGRFCMSIYELC
jgi:5-methylthioribose kinase